MTCKKEKESGVAPHGVHISSSTLQIVIEAFGDVKDALDMLHRQGLLDIHGQSLGGAHGVLYLNSLSN